MTGLILKSIRHYWRANLGALVGTLLASAVLTGALMVGDSVDYSLRTFALQRLGDIDYALDSRNQFLREDFGERLEDAADLRVSSVMRLRGMAIHQGATSADRAQINKVNVHGVAPDFWAFGDGDALRLDAHEVAINRVLATALGVGEGDEISLRVAKPSLMARDSPLSWRDDDRSRRARYTIIRVVSDDAMGRFGLNPSQTASYNAFVDRAFLQDQVELPGRVNLVLAAGEVRDEDVESTWRPADIGLQFRRHESGIVQLESDRIFLSEETSRAAMSLPGAEGVLSYLVNALSKGDALTPYFFAVAGPVPEDLEDDEIVINRWVADELGAGVGDRVTLSYAELLSTNDFETRSREFSVHSIREMDTLETERDLMPVFPGLSDVESCSDWDVGMPMDEELLNDEANEAYWETYGQTPKIFVTLAAGQSMWANRFGNLTSVRFSGAEAATLETGLQAEMDPKVSGLFFRPVRDQATAAVSGAMDFGGLFLGMSFFLIAAALLLTGLLFVFSVQQRATQMGTLLALGFRRKQVRRLILGEGFVVALIGAGIGAGLGTLYTRALIYGLGRYWEGAVANSAILYHAKPTTLFMGAAITLICALLSMALATRRLFKRSGRDLLNMDFGQDAAAATGTRAPGRRGIVLSIAALVAACIVVASAVLLSVQNVAPFFFGAGALLLAAGIGVFRYYLLLLDSGATESQFTGRRLAVLNLARRPGRSMAVVGLMACGCFLVFAVSSMQEDLAAHAHHRDSGTGGFALVADSTFPLLVDPAAIFDSPEVDATAIKVRDGDDASCLNLNQAQTPRLLGVNVAELDARQAFSNEAPGETIWNLLNTELPNGQIPALIGDANTAMWTLKKKSGVKNGDVLVYQDEAGNDVAIKLVGQLPMRLSVFQGSLVISQEAFTRLFPSEDGYRMFLIDAPPERAAEVAATLSQRFDRFGLDAIPAVQRVLEFYAVETTYLAMFLVLGGLGLAIGSAGMSIVILRNLFERRGEIAMLKALGFRSSTLLRNALVEYGFLLAVGLGLGGLAALVATVPTFFAVDSSVDTATQLRIALLVFLVSGSCMFLAIVGGHRRVDFAALRKE